MRIPATGDDAGNHGLVNVRLNGYKDVSLVLTTRHGSAQVFLKLQEATTLAIALLACVAPPPLTD